MQLKSTSTVLIGTLLVAACGSSVGNLDGIRTLGSSFVAMFQRPLNDEPVDAQSVNIADISYTTDPFNP